MKTHKSGFVTLLGMPNAGKSTLMNVWIGESLSIITSKAQTTRHRILGIINGEDFQIVVSDTPGMITPKYKMQKSMMNFVQEAFNDADILVYLVAIGKNNPNDFVFYQKIKNKTIPFFILINKIDLSDQKEVEEEIEKWQAHFPEAFIFPISAKEKFYTREVLTTIVQKMPLSPPYFPKDQLTDKSERFFVDEIVRKNILENFRQEIPYAVEIQTESFKKTSEKINIRSIIIVERESQKAIIIGHKGNALKNIGIRTRKDLERFFYKKIYLDLYIKVIKNWRNEEKFLRQFGYINKTK